jgi:hypothetical protein
MDDTKLNVILVFHQTCASKLLKHVSVMCHNLTKIRRIIMAKNYNGEDVYVQIKE